MSPEKFNRREFLRMAGLIAAGILLSACRPGKQPIPTSISLKAEPTIFPTKTAVVPTGTPLSTATLKPTQTPEPTLTTTPSPTRTPTPTESPEPALTPTLKPTDTPTLTPTPTPVCGELTLKPDQSSVNIRTGPGTNYPILETLDPEEKVLVKGKTTDGWMLGDLVDKEGNIIRTNVWVTGGEEWVEISCGKDGIPVVPPELIPPPPTPRATPTPEPTEIPKVTLPEIVYKIPPFPSHITIHTPGYWPGIFWGEYDSTEPGRNAHAWSGTFEGGVYVDTKGQVHLQVDLDIGNGQNLKEVVLPTDLLPTVFIVCRTQQGDTEIYQTNNPQEVAAILSLPNWFRAHVDEPIGISIWRDVGGKPPQIRIKTYRISMQSW